MTNENLRENIRSFVCRFGRVEMAQIEQMFRSHNQEAIHWHVNSLLYERVFDKDEKGRICSHTPMGVTDYLQSLITYAAWVVSSFGEQKIRNFFVAEYPTQVIFFTTDNRVFDVTVITPNTVKATTQASGRLFKMSVPPKMPDSIRHIALLTHKQMIEEVGQFNVFDYYAVFKSDKGQICGIEVGNYERK